MGSYKTSLFITFIVIFGDVYGLICGTNLKHAKCGSKSDITVNEIRILLYSRKNPKVPEILLQNFTLLKKSNYDIFKPTKIIVHGWKNDVDSEVNVIIKEALLNVSDVNFIYVDWKKGAALSYFSAVNYVPKVGIFLANVIDYLIEYGSPISNFHLVGHSLGAHIVGITGRKVSLGIIPYITGLDPAGFFWGSRSERIRKSDAAYVEIIHTEIHIAGIRDRLGHVDFYPNKGQFMPGCRYDYKCSHKMSIHYFADSIDHKGFMGIRCNDESNASKGKCKGSDSLHMGGLSPKLTNGVFYLKTAETKPFYLSTPTSNTLFN